jgi:predicted nucleic acid-binding protein
MRGVLDTSVLVAGGFDHLDAELAISAVSLAELHFGVLVARGAAVRAARLERVALVERDFVALPVDEAVARTYGRLAAQVQEQGRQPRRRALDLLIAATAVVHGAQLFTRNAADVAGLTPGLDVVALT